MRKKSVYSVSITVRICTLVIFLSIAACKNPEQENILIISTDDIEVVSQGTYKFNGTVVSVGQTGIDEHGFCWSESENPAIDATSIKLGPRISEGSFSSTTSDLLPGKTYYVKAYAIAGSVAVYGGEKSIYTSDITTPTVTDVDNNVYFTIKIGDQTWMASNLKVTHYPDKSKIPLVEDQATWFNFQGDDQAFCWYDNTISNGYTYGGLYTWSAAMHGYDPGITNPGIIQGVCPDGWHLPDDAEWKKLEMFLGMSQATADGKDWRGTDEGGKLKFDGAQYWKAPNTGATNESGFNALPGGWRHGDGVFKNFWISARFWSSTRTGDYAWIRGLDNNSSGIYRNFAGLYEGHSVRCIKD
jgi:uncharacterized protein (TIGR02145 family)